MAGSNATPSRTLIHAAMVVDGAGVRHAPGAILLDEQHHTIIAAGSPGDIGQPDDAVLRDCRSEVIMPGLVNLHAHLDLTHIGPQDYGGDFVAWIDMVRTQRFAADAGDDLRRSVEAGIALSRRGGTVLIGDIAGGASLLPLQVMRSLGMAGVSYLELLGIGSAEDAGLARLQQVLESLGEDPVSQSDVEGAARPGLQPHAPYSCSRRLYEAAAATGLPLSTHLAESPEELELTNSGTGPLAAFLQRLGIEIDAAQRSHADHPLDALRDVFSSKPWVLAHLNYIEDAHLQILADLPITVAYCPRASAYFGHRHHRYRDMLTAGVNVGLGTDSIICLDRNDHISVLDEMRLLYQRDSTDPVQLLQMATVNGAAALGFDPQLVTLQPGPTLGLIGVAVDDPDAANPLRAILRSTAPPQWIHTSTAGHRTDLQLETQTMKE